MVKNNTLKQHAEDDCDFSELMDSAYDDEAMAGVMQGMLETSNNHMALALELTKMALEKNTATNMKEEEVFSVFKRALGVVSESFPLKAMWEKFSSNE